MSLLKKGDIITCPKCFALIATMTMDVARRSIISEKQFNFEKGMELTAGMAIKCRKCNGDFFKGDRMHTNKGWV